MRVQHAVLATFWGGNSFMSDNALCYEGKHCALQTLRLAFGLLAFASLLRLVRLLKNSRRGQIMAKLPCTTTARRPPSDPTRFTQNMSSQGNLLFLSVVDVNGPLNDLVLGNSLYYCCAADIGFYLFWFLQM